MASSPPPPSSSSSDHKTHKESKDQTAPPTLRTIESALKLVDSKKENLKKAYDHLLLSFPSSSSSLSPLPFSWAHLDSHFSSLHHSLSSRFLLLLNSYDSLNSNPGNPDSAPPDQPLIHENATCPASPDAKNPTFADPSSDSNSTPPAPGINENATRPCPDALSRICERMDGKGLRRYVQESGKDPSFTRDEVAGCFLRGRDPAGLALDAVDGFGSLRLMEKKACVLILEALVRAKPAGGFGEEVRGRARRLGVEWVERANLKLGASAEALALLNLVAGFGLAKEIDAEKLVTCCVAISGHPAARALVKEVGLDDAASASLIEKLLEEEKQLLAVRFICELGLADKFRPVDILTSFLKKLKKHRNKSCKEGKHPVATKNHIRSKEISILASAIKIIDEYKLPYQKEDLTKRIDLLAKQKDDELRAPSPDRSFRKQRELEKNQETFSQNENKRPRTMVPTGPVTGSNTWHPSPSQQAARFPGATPYALPDIVARYAGPSTGHYQMPTDAARIHLHPRPQPPYMPLSFGEFRPPYPNNHPYYPQ